MAGDDLKFLWGTLWVASIDGGSCDRRHVFWIIKTCFGSDERGRPYRTRIRYIEWRGGTGLTIGDCIRRFFRLGVGLRTGIHSFLSFIVKGKAGLFFYLLARRDIDG